MHLSLTIYYTIISNISKIQQKYKNIPIVKRSKSQANDIILDACIKFENYPIKTVGEDTFFQFTIFQTIISTFQKFAKIQKEFDRQNKHNRVSYIILDACMQFENYPIKTVGGDILPFFKI